MDTDWARDHSIIRNDTIFVWSTYAEHLDGTVPVHCQRLCSLVSLYCAICPERSTSLMNILLSFHAFPFNPPYDTSVFDHQRRTQLAACKYHHLCSAIRKVSP